MLVTLLGIVMDVRPLQTRKAAHPMLVTLLGIVTEVKPLQSRKAAHPMLVTLYSLPSTVNFERIMMSSVTSGEPAFDDEPSVTLALLFPTVYV